MFLKTHPESEKNLNSCDCLIQAFQAGKKHEWDVKGKNRISPTFIARNRKKAIGLFITYYILHYVMDYNVCPSFRSQHVEYWTYFYTWYLFADNESLINAQHSNITHTSGHSYTIFLITSKYPCSRLPRWIYSSKFVSFRPRDFFYLSSVLILKLP